VPAVKQAGEVGVKALGDAAKSALETPNGQVLTQKVTGTLTEISSQQAAVVQGVKGAVEGVSGAVSGAVDSQKEAVVQGVKGAVEGVTEGVSGAVQGLREQTSQIRR
jgi:phage-related protein